MQMQRSTKMAAQLAGMKGKPKVVRREKKLQFMDYFKEETASWISEAVAKSLGRNLMRLEYLAP